ncbi:glycosyltransferase family 2 protein [Hypholoma sublateritium FD-334 SS-4]|uniref:Glycosyltransferase family 2 protein n=1 Tax=Hypholoma sublateritium (strain FD-334 SS-4) TaxID=945553 RepID=A0A0D2P067_HYPSF|nr:glycosyltransferase family 2 protein [Hypholoma sublateritium FD-334 SS-4]KJA14080.1 glycosyltransferase family 2 protein [Hypholoma sublateritium FD-334 SS-4]
MLNSMNSTHRAQHTACLSNVFLKGEADFRESAKCQVQNYFFVVISVATNINFPIKSRLLSGAAQGATHDDKRKLLFIICDGNIIGSGNDRTTPRIVLGILGGRPIVIFNHSVEGCSEPNVDTLHKMKLFSLSTFKTEFCPDAVVHTMAPESRRILLLQRHRWIS